MPNRSRRGKTQSDSMIVIGVPKGRILEQLGSRLRKAGVSTKKLLDDGRSLVRDDPSSGIRYLLLKPDDVPTYVEYGAADIGFVGRDVLLERGYDLYVPVDLGIGRCRLVVAASGSDMPHLGSRSQPLRVATKFPSIANRHFASYGRAIEVVYVQGSVELAPAAGLADVILDLVETGETLRRNGLVEIETVHQVSTVVVANRVGLKLKQHRIRPLLVALQAA